METLDFFDPQPANTFTKPMGKKQTKFDWATEEIGAPIGPHVTFPEPYWDDDRFWIDQMVWKE